jgi:hypothetical protein
MTESDTTPEMKFMRSAAKYTWTEREKRMRAKISKKQNPYWTKLWNIGPPVFKISAERKETDIQNY